MTGKEKVLVVGSDGLWEFISNEEVKNIIKEIYDIDKENPQNVAERLWDLATERWLENENLVDDITIIVSYFS